MTLSLIVTIFTPVSCMLLSLTLLYQYIVLIDAIFLDGTIRREWNCKEPLVTCKTIYLYAIPGGGIILLIQMARRFHKNNYGDSFTNFKNDMCCKKPKDIK
jgi:hypothetical protein